MTFFLPSQAPQEPIPARGVDTPIPTWWQGLGAHYTSSLIEGGGMIPTGAGRDQASYDLATQVVGTWGEEETRRRLVESGVSEADLDRYGSLDDFLNRNYRGGENGAASLLRLARQSSDLDLDISEEAVEARGVEWQQRELQDARDMASMTEGYSQPIIGGFGAAFSDPPNLVSGVATLGGGTFLTVVAKEALLNVGVEAAFLPQRFQQAETLGIEDPNVYQTLKDAALFGAAFGAGGEAIARGISYFRGTRGRPSPLHPAETQLLVDQAEQAVGRSADPVAETVSTVSAAVQERRAEVVSARPPLILRPEDRVDVSSGNPQVAAPIARPQGGDAPPDAAPLEPAPLAAPVDRTAPVSDPVAEAPSQPEDAPFEPDAQAVAAYDAFEAQTYRDNPGLRPTRRGEPRTLSAWLRSRGGVAWNRRTPEGEKVKTWVAQELEARGITQKQALGVTRNDGSADLDNLDDDMGGDRGLLFGTDDNGYLNRDSIVDALAREISTGRSEPSSFGMKTAMDDLARMRDETFSPPRPPQEDYLAQRRAPEGFYVERGSYSDAGMGDVLEEDFDAYLARRWGSDALSPQEREEILGMLQQEGGDAEYLVQRAIERDLEWAEDGRVGDDLDYWDGLDPAGEGLPAAGGGGDLGSGEAPRAGEGGGVGEATAPLGSERTAAGEQTLVPGVAPITERARLEARMGATLTKAAKAADEGLFDVAARSQMDWLDQPTGPKAKPMQDQRTADLRRLSEEDNRSVTWIDTDGEVRSALLSEALDELDELDELVNVVAACGIGRPTNVPS